jgi:hypothetical protein
MRTISSDSCTFTGNGAPKLVNFEAMIQATRSY